MSILTTTHNAGFFSCCSVKLDDIVQYFNAHRKTPDVVDSSSQFKLYKPSDSKDIDITFHYFKKNYCDDHINNIKYAGHVNFKNTHQFHNYKTLNYERICPFITKYFSPSQEINKIINMMEKKYNINYDNTCVLFYRGNDKFTETKLCEYTDIIKMARDIKLKNPNIKFLIQSDETQFITIIPSLFSNSFYFKDEIRHMNKCNSSVDFVYKNQYKFSKYYLAITLIMSKCKHVICNSSGNCSLWIALYRGNADNFKQYFKGTFV